MSVHVVLGGGIGSGKSTVARRFAHLGAHVISADDKARHALAPGTPAHAAVVERWPEVAVAGVVDRAALGSIVFADPEALGWLEALTHPSARAAIEAEVAAHPAADVVVEIPVLRDWFDGWTTVVVDAPDEIRVARATARADSMTENDVHQVIARQPSRAEWLMAADLVIDNRGDLTQLEAECALVWAALHTV